MHPSSLYPKSVSAKLSIENVAPSYNLTAKEVASRVFVGDSNIVGGVSISGVYLPEWDYQSDTTPSC